MKANKIRLLFICHGNICRSPIAEYIFRHLCRERGVAEMFEVDSMSDDQVIEEAERLGIL